MVEVVMVGSRRLACGVREGRIGMFCGHAKGFVGRHG